MHSRAVTAALCFVVLTVLVIPLVLNGGTTLFRRSDVNADGHIDISDPIALLGFLFGSDGSEPPCGDAADANDDGALDIADAVYIVGVLFTGYSSPPAPYAACGSDPTNDELPCLVFPPCPPEESVEAEWVARYSAAEFSHDHMNALATDAMGNVYVTGYSSISYDGGSSYTEAVMVTVKYDQNGDIVWFDHHNSPEDSAEGFTIVVDEAGDVYVAGVSDSGPSAGQDIVVAKYANDGTELWVVRYDGGGRDLVADMLVDGQGNVYVTAESDMWTDTEEDWVTVKFDPAGEFVWATRFDGPAGPGGHADYPFALAFAPDGSIIVAGSGHSGPSLADYTIVKYTTDGELVWTTYYDGEAHGADYATAVALDGNGNIYVTGHSAGVESSSDIVTVKLSSEGQVMWDRRLDGPGHSGDSAITVVVDSLDRVYVAGSVADEGENDTDFVTVSYEADGTLRWITQYDGPESGGRDSLHAMALGPAEDLYVTGTVNGGSGHDQTRQDYCTIKYDCFGNQRWVAIYDGPGEDWDDAQAVVAGSEGRVYVTGTSEGDAATVSYVTPAVKVP